MTRDWFSDLLALVEMLTIHIPQIINVLGTLSESSIQLVLDEHFDLDMVTKARESIFYLQNRSTTFVTSLRTLMQTSLTALEINTNEGVVSEVLLKEINGEFPQLRDLHNSLADADKRMEELCLTITEKQSVLSREKIVPSR